MTTLIIKLCPQFVVKSSIIEECRIIRGKCRIIRGTVIRQHGWDYPTYIQWILSIVIFQGTKQNILQWTIYCYGLTQLIKKNALWMNNMQRYSSGHYVFGQGPKMRISQNCQTQRMETNK